MDAGLSVQSRLYNYQANVRHIEVLVKISELGVRWIEGTT